jgi:hypothetical protein
MKQYVDNFWPNLKPALDGQADVSSHSIVFQNVVILVFNFSQDLPFESVQKNEQALKNWIADEDESKQVTLSFGLKLLKKRSNKRDQTSISVNKVTIVPRDQDQDVPIDDLPMTALQIKGIVHSG